MLKLQFKDQRKPAIWLVDARYSIGSDQNNDIVLEDAGVSGYHADIQVEDNDRIFLTDAGSVSGTKVNGQPVQGRTQLRANDVIGIHSVELELLDPKEQARSEEMEGGATAISPALQGIGLDEDGAGAEADWILQARTGSLVGQRFDIPGHGTLTIGRSRDCDLVLPSNHVSRHHAELYLHSGQPWVRDLDSSNGTYVNRKKVHEQGLQDGDELRFDTLIFEVRGPEREDGDQPAPAAAAEEGSSTQFQGAVAADEAGTGGTSAPADESGPASASPTPELREPESPAAAVPAGESTADESVRSGSGMGGLIFVAVLVVLGAGLAWWVLQG